MKVGSRPWFAPECGAPGAQGWNIDYLAPDLVRPASTAPSGVWKAAGDGTVPDTLLGPEGSDESLTSGRLRPRTLTVDEPPSLLGRRRHR